MTFDHIIASMTPEQKQAVAALIDLHNECNSELRARVAELEVERAELVKDRERSPSHSFAGILVWKGDHSYSYAITEHAINNGTCDPFAVALHEAMKAIDAAREGE